MIGRIKKDKVLLDKKAVENFFSKRTEKKLPHRYNYVIYQDDNPNLAIKRDKYEKEKITKLLNIGDNTTVLDIGCGVGRWADEIKNTNIKKYVGIDFTSDFLKIARENFQNEDRFEFVEGAFQDLDRILIENKCISEYDFIFINGVCMYVNDDEIDGCLQSVANHVNANGRIYIKEGVAANDRFTLKDFNSQELSATYNAIYRSLTECKKLIEKHFPITNWVVEIEAPTWPEDLENRKETLNYFWIIRRR